MRTGSVQTVQPIVQTVQPRLRCTGWTAAMTGGWHCLCPAQCGTAHSSYLAGAGPPPLPLLLPPPHTQARGGAADHSTSIQQETRSVSADLVQTVRQPHPSQQTPADRCRCWGWCTKRLVRTQPGRKAGSLRPRRARSQSSTPAKGITYRG